MNESIFRATFSDIKTIKTRKVVQFVFEIAQEQANHALDCLGGLPRSDIDTWVAIAKLQTVETQLEPKKPRQWSQIPPSQQAGIRCQDPEFLKWLGGAFGIFTADESAGWIRDKCKVSSRSQLDTHQNAQELWYQIDQEFMTATGKIAEQR